MDAALAGLVRLTVNLPGVVMLFMSEPVEQPPYAPVRAAMCVDADAFNRLGKVLRHLAVGLVDQAVGLQLVGSGAWLNSLALGPIQTVIHQKLSWPRAARRRQQLVEVLSHQPPTVVHGVSVESYRAAREIAEPFEADLVLQVTSQADVDGIGPAELAREGRIIASSQPLYDQLIPRCGDKADRIELIRPGLLAGSKMTSFTREGQLATLVCTADLEREKRVNVLIEAVALLRKNGLDLLLFLLGRGSQDAVLRRMVRRRGLSSVVTFATPLGDLTRALESADVFVHPSTGHAFTVGALQAMAAGVVVVTCENSACDHYRDGETAVLCAEAKPEVIAAAIEKVVMDRAFARRIAEGGLEYVRAHHSVSGMAERTAAVYRRLALARATISIAE
jgi:glycosyltransferase involved in cell wall biosynthesis